MFAEITRDRDGSEFGGTLLPRVKFAYQPRRSLFFQRTNDGFFVKLAYLLRR